MAHHREAFRAAALGFALTVLLWSPTAILAHVEKAERLRAYERSIAGATQTSILARVALSSEAFKAKAKA